MPWSGDRVSQMRPSATTGEEWPSPGSSVFQTIFSVSLHVVGSPVTVDLPSRVEPRNSLHVDVSAAYAPSVNNMFMSGAIRVILVKVFMG